MVTFRGYDLRRLLDGDDKDQACGSGPGSGRGEVLQRVHDGSFAPSLIISGASRGLLWIRQRRIQ